MSQEAVRQVLQAKQEEYRSRIEGVSRDLRREENPLEKDSGEAAVQLENEEVLKGLLAEAEHELDRVVKAISRLDTGTYGVCVRCGNDIESARLQAMPQAECCIRCA